MVFNSSSGGGSQSGGSCTINDAKQCKGCFAGTTGLC